MPRTVRQITDELARLETRKQKLLKELEAARAAKGVTTREAESKRRRAARAKKKSQK